MKNPLEMPTAAPTTEIMSMAQYWTTARPSDHGDDNDPANKLMDEMKKDTAIDKEADALWATYWPSIAGIIRNKHFPDKKMTFIAADALISLGDALISAIGAELMPEKMPDNKACMAAARLWNAGVIALKTSTGYDLISGPDMQIIATL